MAGTANTEEQKRRRQQSFDSKPATTKQPIPPVSLNTLMRLVDADTDMVVVLKDGTKLCVEKLALNHGSNELEVHTR